MRNLSQAALQPATLQLAACNLAACSLATCLPNLTPAILQPCSCNLRLLRPGSAALAGGLEISRHAQTQTGGAAKGPTSSDNRAGSDLAPANDTEFVSDDLAASNPLTRLAIQDGTPAKAAPPRLQGGTENNNMIQKHPKGSLAGHSSPMFAKTRCEASGAPPRPPAHPGSGL